MTLALTIWTLMLLKTTAMKTWWHVDTYTVTRVRQKTTYEYYRRFLGWFSG